MERRGDRADLKVTDLSCDLVGSGFQLSVLDVRKPPGMQVELWPEKSKNSIIYIISRREMGQNQKKAVILLNDTSRKLIKK